MVSFPSRPAAQHKTTPTQKIGQTRLGGVTLHECRHSYAAFMIAAGVNAKALCTYMGHSTITVSLDRYGHLHPGNERPRRRATRLLLDGTAGDTAAR